MTYALTCCLTQALLSQVTNEAQSERQRSSVCRAMTSSGSKGGEGGEGARLPNINFFISLIQQTLEKANCHGKPESTCHCFCISSTCLWLFLVSPNCSLGLLLLPDELQTYPKKTKNSSSRPSTLTASQGNPVIRFFPQPCSSQQY